jgi:hypothetical protein
MPRKTSTYRLTEMTMRQIKKLAEVTGSSDANVISTAIDRMYQQEIPTMTTQADTITIERINTKPEHDPYTNIGGIASRTTLKLDPRDRTVWVTQEYNDNSTPMDEWHNLVLTWRVNSYPRETEMREWITDNLDTLTTICDGFEAHWNGNNIVGRYTDEARAAAESIEFLFDNDGGPINYYEFWTVESWLESSRDEITADMTDEQLQELAGEWEGTDDIVMDGSILDFITEIRDTLKYEQEEEVDEDDKE